MRRPSIGQTAVSDERYYYLVLVLFLLAALGIWLIQTTRLGRLLKGYRDSPLALTAHGTSITVTLVIVFSFSAFRRLLEELS